MEPLAPVRGVKGVGRRHGAADDVAQLYASSYPRLVGVLALAAGSQAEAEEVVQEAFVRLLRQWPTVSRFDDPEAWTRKVAFRLLSNRLRKIRNGTRAMLRHGPATDVPAPSSDPVDVTRALAVLPLAQRQVVVLHHLLDMDLHEIASVLGVPVGTVKSRLHRARASLSPVLAEETFRA